MNSQTAKESDSAAKGITRLTIRGFKSLIEECSIEIRPLTILAGANSSGKSSALQPLLLLKQTLEATFDPGALLINGPNVRFTSAEQILSRRIGEPSADRFSIGIEVDSNEALTGVFQKLPKKPFELVEMVYSTGRRITRLHQDMANDDILRLIPSFIDEMILTREQFIQLERDIQRVVPSYIGVLSSWEPDELVEPLEWHVYRRRCFLYIATSLGDKSGPAGSLIAADPSPSFEPHIRRIIHVPGLRGNPERNYRTTAIGDEFPGTFENYVASMINHWQVTRDFRVKRLGELFETLGLTWKVEANQVNDAEVELKVGRLRRGARGGTRDMVSIADVGFGISQCLPVLVALLAAEPHRMVYVEQPEIHLHPRAQVALARVLVDAAKRGVRVVVETHSALLLLAVQSLVAEGYIEPAQVKLHWFKRRDDGITQVTSADLDEAGAFGDWPEDFAEVSLEAESRYLDAAEKRQRAC